MRLQRAATTLLRVSYALIPVIDAPTHYNTLQLAATTLQQHCNSIATSARDAPTNYNMLQRATMHCNNAQTTL